LGCVSEQQRVVCPHCGKEFEAELMTSISAPGPRGFKCPHCRLFVPADRALEADEPAA
jgi:DNA-directed RNA polymerase subunit RPC12/RpoP